MSGLLNLGSRAILAAQAQLDTTASNIAGAGVAGYSRQTVQLQTAGSQFNGSGFFGRGVDVVGVTRAYNAFLTREAGTAQSLAAADAARSTQLQRLEQAFPLGEAGLGHAAGQLLGAFADVASRPADLAARQVVLGRTADFAAQLRTAAGRLDSLQAGVSEELRTSVATVNGMTAQVAELNQQIARAQGLGHAPNELLDRRDQLVREIGAHIQVTQVPAGDGTVGLFVGGGQRLVLGAEAVPLRALPDPHDNAVLRLALAEPGGDRPIPEGAIVGGSIAGLLRFQREDLAGAQNQLGRLAVALGSALNDQQAAGLDLDGQPGAPLLALGAPRALPGAGNAGTAVAHLAIGDASQLQASDYELRRDGAVFRLTRLADGASLGPAAGYSAAELAAGIAVEGLSLRLDGEAAAGDRFLLQPLRRAAAGAEGAIADPRRLAAAAPAAATLSPGNLGTMMVASFAPRGPDTLPPEGVTLAVRAVDPSSGAITYTLGGAEHTAEAGAFISHYGWEMRLAGTPRPGDQIEIGATRAVAASNGNALALLGLRDAPLVGQRAADGGPAQGGMTLADAWAGLLGDLGVRVQGARAAAQGSQAAAQQAEAARGEVAGVNLDEEAARLIQYQQAYQAAGKVLQVAQSVFDTLLNSLGR